MKDDDIFIYLMLIVIGYFIAKMFSRSSCNGFNVGGYLRYSQGPIPNTWDCNNPPNGTCIINTEGNGAFPSEEECRAAPICQGW